MKIKFKIIEIDDDVIWSHVKTAINTAIISSLFFWYVSIGQEAVNARLSVLLETMRKYMYWIIDYIIAISTLCYPVSIVLIILTMLKYHYRLSLVQCVLLLVLTIFIPFLGGVIAFIYMYKQIKQYNN